MAAPGGAAPPSEDRTRQRPGSRHATVSLREGEVQVAYGPGLQARDGQGDVGGQAHPVADGEVLPPRFNAPGVGDAHARQALEQVEAVEAAAPVAHLHQPGPDLRGRGVNAGLVGLDDEGYSAGVLVHFQEAIL